jgi:hypothetical protein
VVDHPEVELQEADLDISPFSLVPSDGKISATDFALPV